jgi:hypothetical protein
MQQVSTRHLRRRKSYFESLCDTEPFITGTASHNNDRHPAYVRFARFIRAGQVADGPSAAQLALTPGPRAAS